MTTQTKALKHLKAITEAFGPDEGIELDQKAWSKLHDAIKEALANHIPDAKKMVSQPEQEPVAWLHWLHGPVRLFLNKDEAMMELDRLNREYPVDKDARQMKPLYTTPRQRTWVGLDHHDKKTFSSWLDHKSDDEVFSAIEAKLKELNT